MTTTIDTESPTAPGELIIATLAAHLSGVVDADDPHIIGLALLELRRLAESRGHDWSALVKAAEGARL